MESPLDAWLERILEDESWQGGLSDAQAERLLRWALDRVRAHPEAAEAVRHAMRRIGRAVRVSEEEAAALLAEWGLRVPSDWPGWSPGERLAWVLEALAGWNPPPAGG